MHWQRKNQNSLKPIYLQQKTQSRKRNMLKKLNIHIWWKERSQITIEVLRLQTRWVWLQPKYCFVLLFGLNRKFNYFPLLCDINHFLIRLIRYVAFLTQ